VCKITGMPVVVKQVAEARLYRELQTRVRLRARRRSVPVGLIVPDERPIERKPRGQHLFQAGRHRLPEWPPIISRTQSGSSSMAMRVRSVPTKRWDQVIAKARGVVTRVASSRSRRVLLQPRSQSTRRSFQASSGLCSSQIAREMDSVVREAAEPIPGNEDASGGPEGVRITGSFGLLERLDWKLEGEVGPLVGPLVAEVSAPDRSLGAGAGGPSRHGWIPGRLLRLRVGHQGPTSPSASVERIEQTDSYRVIRTPSGPTTRSFVARIGPQLLDITITPARSGRITSAASLERPPRGLVSASGSKNRRLREEGYWVSYAAPLAMT